MHIEAVAATLGAVVVVIAGMVIQSQAGSAPAVEGTSFGETTWPTVALAARIVLGGLFAAAGVNKLRRPFEAAVAAVQFRIVGHATARVGYAFGLVELVIATMLFTRAPMAIAGCVIAGLLSLGFVVIAIRALRRGERFRCECVSPYEYLSWATPTRAGAMVVAAAIGGIGVPDDVPSKASLSSAVGLAIASIGIPYTIRLTWKVIHHHRVLFTTSNVRDRADAYAATDLR